MQIFRKIFQNRNLTLLWLGQMVSQSGDSIYQIGLMWLVLELSGSESVTGLVAMASYLPAVLLSLFAGVAADRYNRRKIMLSADALRFGIVLVIPFAHLAEQLSPAVLGINAFTLAIAATFFNPARDSLIPQIVPKNGLMRANSLIQTSWQFSLLLGPALAGLLLYYVGNVHLFTLDSLAYLSSFVFIFLIRYASPSLSYRPVENREGENMHNPSDPRYSEENNPNQPPPRFPEGNEKGGRLQTVPRKPGLVEIREGLVWTFRHPVILPLLLITIADNLFIMGPAIVGTPVLVKIELGLGAESYALVMACYAIGMLLGTAALLTFGSRFRKGQVLLVGMILDGLTFIPIYFVNSIEILAVIIIIHSLAIPMLTVSRASLIQSLVPNHMTGRIFALVNLSVIGMSALSSGMTGFALELWGARTVFLVIGVGGAMCGILGWIFAVKLRKQE